MKAELSMTLAGEMAIEIIAETEAEYRLFNTAWELNGYRRASGQSVAPNGYKTGFYIDLCDLKKPARSLSDSFPAGKTDDA